MLRGCVVSQLGSRWSARSAARTNDLDAGENRRMIASDPVGLCCQFIAAASGSGRSVKTWVRGVALPYLGARAVAGPAT